MQLRPEGIDTAELHYGSAAQPSGLGARDALLELLGFEKVTDGGGPGHVVNDARPQSVEGAILTSGVDPNGRVIAYTIPPVAVARSRDAWTAGHPGATAQLRLSADPRRRRLLHRVHLDLVFVEKWPLQRRSA